MTEQELRRLARLGAEARLEALQREIVAIYQVFPELRSGRSNVAPNPYSAGVRSAVAGAVTRRRRPKLSAEARERIAQAQKKRWVEWRAKKGTGEEEEASKEPATPKRNASRGYRKKK